MRSGAIPFQFDVSEVLGRLRRLTSGSVTEVALQLPFLSITVAPRDLEKKIAREIVIRLKDRRVLSAWECCDSCIDQALASLQEIRRILVDKQVELSDAQDGPLYLLVELMAAGIRQFLTYEQALQRGVAPPRGLESFHRPDDVRQAYFDALELLRGHLSRCLGQIAALGGIEMPSEGVITHYQGGWQVEAYKV